MYNNETSRLERIPGQRLIYFLFSVVISLFAIVIALNPGTLTKFIADADTAELLLKGYGNWYLMFWMICIVVLLFMALFGIIALAFYAFKGDHSFPLKLVIQLSIFMSIVFSIMLKDIDPHSQYKSYMNDVASIQEGDLISEEVHLHPESEKAGLANHGKNYPKPLTEYSATIVGTPSGWNKIYIPDFIDFTPDANYLYNENRPIDWNEEYSSIYRITYTPNYKVVTNIELIQEGKEDPEE